MHKLIFSAITILLISFSEGQAQHITRGPYLQAPTSESIILRWRSDIAHIGSVWYGTSPNHLNQSATENGYYLEHELQLQQLTPNTRYYYAIYSGNTLLVGADSSHYFYTFPLAGSTDAYRIWAIGDFGKGNPLQARVRDAFLQHNGDKKLDLWLWLGDNAYTNGSDTDYQNKVFSGPTSYQDIFKHQHFHATPGNHDYNLISPMFGITTYPFNQTGAYFDIVNAYQQAEAGGYPSGTELYYSFDYGNIHIISINSELGSTTNQNHDWTGAHPTSPFHGSPMMYWLVCDLEQNVQPWTIVMFHQPPYSKGSHDSDKYWERYMYAMRTYWLPLLDQAGVDLVLSGHSHVYERSYLMKGHYGYSSTWNPASMLVDGSSGNPDLGESYLKDSFHHQGTIYVVQGNSGASSSNPELNHPAFYANYGCDTCGGSTIIEVHGDTLRGQLLSMNGQILDQYQIIKSSYSTVRDIKLPDYLHQQFNLLYPNPSTGIVTLESNFDETAMLDINIYDASGKFLSEVMQTEVLAGKQSLSLNLGAYTPISGTYYLQCIVSGQSYLLPIVIRKE